MSGPESLPPTLANTETTLALSDTTLADTVAEEAGGAAKDMALVVAQAKVGRAQAVASLRAKNNRVSDAVLHALHAASQGGDAGRASTAARKASCVASSPRNRQGPNTRSCCLFAPIWV